MRSGLKLSWFYLSFLEELLGVIFCQSFIKALVFAYVKV